MFVAKSASRLLPRSSVRWSSTSQSFNHILIDKKGQKENVGLITLNRTKARNALCNDVVTEISLALKEFERDDGVGSIVITGNEKAFAAGADVKEMFESDFSKNIKVGLLTHWYDISSCKKPLIAAVNGYALGGGCELALMCDIIYAGETAQFGQLEILVGLIPGGGGTQRIARSCGKSNAMEICLTGRQFTAQEAKSMGLVSKVLPVDQLLNESIKLGEKIASNSVILNMLCKESVNVAFETSLAEGLRFERKMFYATFATEDQKEGMKAFIEKRAPDFKNK